MSPVDAHTPFGVTLEPAMDAAVSAQERSQDVAKLLADLAKVTPQVEKVIVTTADAKYENKLAIVRLGMATSLYSALRAKHPPTASHCLRVAIVCAAWGERLNFDQIQRDRLEVAALLHDIGKIGIPDQILRKPGKLSLEEQLTVSLGPQLACEILRGCCGDQELLDIIQHASAWYSGRRDQPQSGEEIPVGSRMLAIADAFDAMTTDHVYRPAMSREAAIGQLLVGRGAQFDPELTQDFCVMMQQAPEQMHRQVLRRWLQPPVEQTPDDRWTLRRDAALMASGQQLQDSQSRFHSQLLSNMSDGVIYIDRNGIIQGWNPAAETMTGITESAVLTQLWSPTMLGLCDDKGEIHEDDCPIRHVLNTSTYVNHVYTIRKADGNSIPVRLHVAPVSANEPGLCGVVVIAHDASQQRNLEERVESLHQQATHDPLTKVANRAAFDRRLRELVQCRMETGVGFSLIICDIDHFKKVNDLHGHQAGDDALVSFAAVLSKHSRERDFVSRYGGEEFVILAPDCDLATATLRAETIRESVELTRLPSIGNQSVTASFGVTEAQPGDSPESVLARADRALLQAKDGGRNQVIQLTIGGSDQGSTTKRRRRIWSWFDAVSDTDALNTENITPVPVNFAIEKLRGFIADHKAEIVSVSEGNLHLRQNVVFTTNGRRSADSQISFSVRLRLTEVTRVLGTEGRQTSQLYTTLKVEIEPTRTRDRRRQEVASCANQIVVSLKSYLMGRIESE